MKIYKYFEGRIVIAEARKTKKMYVVDKIINKKPGYNGFYVTERLYEREISFTAYEAFQAQRNKLRERASRHREIAEKAYDDWHKLDTYESKFKEKSND